ncbi:hypothetical protein NDU88_006880 [Pleurodeles waltl]|uniref:Uncharacterized protein n=1 Tax=Pleurodeles waltl TaxID=8319 RepID=A0AAV7MEQ7_PLEWA|nr:hypothetical protein NDU88_006880 [Pleurodeles waltl]
MSDSDQRSLPDSDVDIPISQPEPVRMPGPVAEELMPSGALEDVFGDNSSPGPNRSNRTRYRLRGNPALS